ncbi:MAPEG family protein [Methylosinus sp. H3A]|uniref:MAPEG family protein n=1 Tax=Methylosinus sp. H3A TaxID=2785786 RepID=UPI0018C1EB3E|nr:MAPEG family protein [Methylosinus sp. H3A]MBG0811254.1 MAPEG family protein [Methylosinus sp. H3A]
MTNALSPELYWTVLTAGLASVLWIPYILQRILQLGPIEAFRDPLHDVATKAPWAQRAKSAHTNMIENLLVFAVLALTIQIVGGGTAATASAALLFFASRAAHYAVYTLGLPWVRTPMFLIGFGCQITLLLAILAHS